PGGAGPGGAGPGGVGPGGVGPGGEGAAGVLGPGGAGPGMQQPPAGQPGEADTGLGSYLTLDPAMKVVFDRIRKQAGKGQPEALVTLVAETSFLVNNLGRAAQEQSLLSPNNSELQELINALPLLKTLALEVRYVGVSLTSLNSEKAGATAGVELK